eukprot:680810-Pelagomonas_calceolata.AAC.1
MVLARVAFSARLLPWACQCMPTVQNVLTASCAQDAALLDGPSTSGKCAQLRSFAKKSAHQ